MSYQEVNTDFPCYLWLTTYKQQNKAPTVVAIGSFHLISFHLLTADCVPIMAMSKALYCPETDAIKGKLLHY